MITILKSYGDWDVNPRYSTPYFQCLDTVPVADIIQYKNYMASPDDGKNRLLTMARQSISYPEEYLNDIIGTRLIRAPFPGCHSLSGNSVVRFPDDAKHIAVCCDA